MARAPLHTSRKQRSCVFRIPRRTLRCPCYRYRNSGTSFQGSPYHPFSPKDHRAGVNTPLCNRMRETEPVASNGPVLLCYRLRPILPLAATDVNPYLIRVGRPGLTTGGCRRGCPRVARNSAKEEAPGAVLTFGRVVCRQTRSERRGSGVELGSIVSSLDDPRDRHVYDHLADASATRSVMRKEADGLDIPVH